MKLKIAVASLIVICTAGAGAFRFPVGAQAPAGRSVWDGVYTAEQAKRGEAAYDQFCSTCHGAALTGGEMAPALAGGDFTSNWNGTTVGDLFERIRISMPQNNPGSLSRQQNADILAHLLSFSKFPAGKAELAAETEALKQIKFEAAPAQR